MANDYEVRDATVDDAVALAPRMRQADIDECVAMGFGAEDALITSVRASMMPMAGLVNGEVVCLFGVGSVGMFATSGAPWLLGSIALDRRRFTLIKMARQWIDYQLSIYPLLENWVDARNNKSIKLVRWLGFEIDDPKPFGVDGEMFRRFWKEA